MKQYDIFGAEVEVEESKNFNRLKLKDCEMLNQFGA